MSKISDFLKFSNETGLPVPLARDSARPGSPPSVSLFFLYITNILAVLSLICLHFRAEAGLATAATCIYGIAWVVLYLMRNLQKAKVDLDNKSFEIEGEEEDADPKQGQKDE